MSSHFWYQITLLQSIFQHNLQIILLKGIYSSPKGVVPEVCNVWLGRGGPVSQKQCKKGKEESNNL